ncbi:hypothetical protein E2542_SST21729 [Spatholobus suberectus]|nr:hypothetical protein E2542_SST21729 [Spatholobus suberectus]
MKFPGEASFPAGIASRTVNPSPDSDLQPAKPFPRRRPRTPGTRLRRHGGKRSRPETPLLKWKIHDDPLEEDQKSSVAGFRRRTCRTAKKQTVVAMSARRLAAGLWRSWQLVFYINLIGFRFLLATDVTYLQHGIGHAGLQFLGHPPNGVTHDSDMRKNLSQSPRSIFGTKNGHFCEPEPFQFTNTEMEGATKWDPLCLKTSDEAQHIYSHIKLLDQKASAVSVVSALGAELEQARARIQELETEHRSSKKKLEHFLKKVSEERAQWRSREHEKIRAYIDDVKAELNRERKNRQRIEIVNSSW